MKSKNLNKIIYILWGPLERDKDETRNILLNQIAGEILDLGVEKLVMYIADSDSDVKPPGLKHPYKEMITAEIEVWMKEKTAHPGIEKVLADAAFRCAAYLADESIYREYGGNMFMHQRDWPDGRRSPGVVAVTLLKRPPKISADEWVKRWHGIMSPVSEKIQPRSRYVRNLITERLSPEAPAYDGIVIEAWPSKRHVSSSFLFYGAENVFQLLRNMFSILRAVRSFLRIRDIRTVMMSEYFIKTDF
jgi:hypothetical protein